MVSVRRHRAAHRKAIMSKAPESTTEAEATEATVPSLTKANVEKLASAGANGRKAGVRLAKASAAVILQHLGENVASGERLPKSFTAEMREAVGSIAFDIASIGKAWAVADAAEVSDRFDGTAVIGKACGRLYPIATRDETVAWLADQDIGSVTSAVWKDYFQATKVGSASQDGNASDEMLGDAMAEASDLETVETDAVTTDEAIAIARGMLEHVARLQADGDLGSVSDLNALQHRAMELFANAKRVEESVKV